MKILCLGDLHVRMNKPENRMDEAFYDEILKGKLQFILDTAIEHKVDIVVQPGDFFDSFRASYSLVGDMIAYCSKFKERGIDILVVWGQHDMRYHSVDKENTPLGVLTAAGLVHQLKPDYMELKKYPEDKKAVYLYGSSWGEEIPDKAKEFEGVHILVAHIMTINDKLWGKQTDYVTVGDMFRLGFDLVVTGDNHQGFSYSDGENHLINCGSLLRTNIDQADHQPYVYVYDTEKNKVTGIPIPVKPFSEVMNIIKAKKEKERNAEMEAFVSGLEGKVSIEGLDYKNNVDRFIKNNNIRTGVVKYLQEALSCQTK